jgi:maleylacetate reductase
MSLGGNAMEAFQYTALPARVVFGFGTIDKVADELASLGRKRAFVISDPHHATAAAARLMRALGDLGVHLSTDAIMHTPVEVTERVLEKLAACDADCIIALGGGSTIGLAKALALRTDLPQIVLPTTYAGSEATPVLGETRDGQKSTLHSMKVLPEVIVYDVELTYGLSLVSGINAIAHAVEALYAKDANPVTSSLAEQGIAALGRALPRIVADPTNPSGRADALFGAWVCGSCLGAVGMSLHHKLCHVWGLSAFRTPRRTLWSCRMRMRWPITPAVRRLRSVAWLVRLVQIMLHRLYSILPHPTGLPSRFARSVCPIPIWMQPPRQQSNHLIGIRVPSSGMRFGNYWTTHITDDGLLERGRTTHRLALGRELC